MDDDPFAELEKQLAEIATYGSKKNTPTNTRSSLRLENPSLLSPTSAVSSSRLSPSNLAPTTAIPPPSLQNTQQVQQLQSQLNQSQQQISKLEKELEQWKNTSKEANQRALTLQEKLHTMANAVREERSLQKQSEEELERRAEAAESRAEALEEKLIKLVEIVKRDRASKALDNSGAAQLSQMIELQRKNTELQQEIQVLSEQQGALEGELLNQESMRKQDQEAIHQLQKQAQDLLQKLSQAEEQSENAQSALHQKIQKLEIQISHFQENEKHLKSELNKAIHERDQTTLRASTSGSLDAEERAEKAEALARDYEAKIQKLVTAVKAERITLKAKLDEAVAKAQEESERANELERRLAERPVTTPSVDNSPPMMFDDAPAPPPPPPPAFKVIDPSKITLKKSEGGHHEEKPRDAKAENMANLINEIKNGVKLKSVSTIRNPPSSAKGEVDLGALATEIAKSRQKRTVNKPANSAPPRKSVALTNLLKELDGL